ncbi:MAG: DUF1565 domain-containing protein [Planctomycetota bacterium]
MRFLPPPLALLLAAAAQANDVWVDPVTGDDSNPGTEQQPLRTISAAVALPDASIFLVPGVYSAASGETFPITLEGMDSITSTGNASNTRYVLSDVAAYPYAPTIEIKGDASITGVTLQQLGTNSTVLAIGDTPYTIDCRLVLSDSTIIGGALGASGGDNGYLSIERCEFREQDYAGISIFRSLTTIRDTTIRNARNGIVAGMMGGIVTIQRAAILDVEENAIFLQDANYAVPLRASIEDCLLAGHEVGVYSHDGWLWNEVEIKRCTIVSDRGYGVRENDHSWGGFLHVTDSIIAGHTLADTRDVNYMANSIVEDGSIPSGHVDCISGDPIFVDPANGDYRLGWGSPGIDAAAPGFSRDLAGHARVVDGDLQLVPAPDIGALEHRTLNGPSSIRFGQAIPLEVTGPMGGYSTVVISPPGFAAVGATTIYGRYFLDPTNNFRLPSVPTFGRTPTQLMTPSITDSSLIGTQIGIQALTRSVAAPAGGAFSQPLLVRVDP